MQSSVSSANDEPHALYVSRIETALIVEESVRRKQKPSDLRRGGGQKDWVPIGAHFAALRRATSVAEDESLQLSRRPLAPGTTDFVIETVCRAENFGAALKQAARAYNLIHGGYFNRVERRRDRLIYTIDDRGFPYSFEWTNSGPGFALMEGIMIFLHAMAGCALGGLAPQPLAVKTRRPSRTAPDGLLAFWDAPVRTNAAAYALEYDAAAARLPILKGRRDLPTTDGVFDAIDALIAAREASVRRQDLPDLILAALADGASEQTEIARTLGMSVATLRRRLAESGASFRGVRRDALNARAHALLAQGRPVTDIADALGFADIRSFSRAFKAWNGATPAAYAERLGALRRRR